MRRRKLEHLINEFVHKRTVTRRLISSGVTGPKAFQWLCQMRFYFDPRQPEVLRQLTIHMANARFHYGFEYLGVQDRLVQTPLTDRCYLTMTQALETRLGGSPFGPAGKFPFSHLSKGRGSSTAPLATPFFILLIFLPFFVRFYFLMIFLFFFFMYDFFFLIFFLFLPFFLSLFLKFFPCYGF